MTSIKDIVKGQNAHFVFFQDDTLFYETDAGFLFPIPVSDIGSTRLSETEKAIRLMRWVRRHLENTKAAKAEMAE